MKEVYIVLKEQLTNLKIIQRLAKYEEKSTYQAHILGLFWQILNPILQILTYYLIFSVFMNRGDMEGYSYMVWLLIGFITWLFMNSTVLSASNSMVRQVGMVSKMNFPVSTIPSMSLASQLINYWWMLGIVVTVYIFGYGVYPTIYWLQFGYYFFCMITFLYAVGLVTSTITVILRDFHILLITIMRFLMYVSGSIMTFNGDSVPILFKRALALNPFYYIISGMRDTFLSRAWFFNDIIHMVIFWSITFLLLIIGSNIHLKFRARFIDYI